MPQSANIAKREQKILQISIAFTSFLTITGIIIGLVSGATAILFDAIYAAIDVVFSVAALLVAKLIYLDAHRQQPPAFAKRFGFGFWHLEPIVLLINGIALTISLFYAILNSFNLILNGGHIPDFNIGMTFAFFGGILSLIMAIYEHRANKHIQSDFIAVDIKSWLISACISGALLVAFLGGYLLEEGPYSGWVAYIDPVILIIIALLILPMPLKIVASAAKDVLHITPRALEAHVRQVADEIVQRYQFENAYFYVAKIGRSIQIEIHFVTPKHYPIKSSHFLDQIREEISQAIGDAGPDRWLTIAFTGDKKWAI